MIAAIIAGITAVLLIAVYLLMPAPQMDNAKSNSLDNFNYPTNDNGRVVPEVFGTVEVFGNVMWYGDLRSTKIER